MSITYETQALLLDLGIGYWLNGFEIVGEAIDIVRVNLRKNESQNYYKILAERNGMDGKQVSDVIRRTVAVAWRGHKDAMHRTLGIGLEQPPAPRWFVYTAAEYLNEQEEKR